jgi:hypothetical protein
VAGERLIEKGKKGFSTKTANHKPKSEASPEVSSANTMILGLTSGVQGTHTILFSYASNNKTIH